MQSQALAEPVIRPKVMRRPAQFAGEQANNEPMPEDISEARLPIPYQSPVRYWQEDARFGLALVAMVVVTNILLMVCLPLLTPHKMSSMTDIAATEHATPATNETARGAITIYTQPGNISNNSSLTAHRSLVPLLTITPSEMPIPRAKPLEGNSE